MRQSHISVVLAALLLAGVAGCANGEPAAAPPPVAASSSATPASSAMSAPTASAARAVPLTVTRRGGFAGVEESVSIAADGSATATRKGQAAAPVRVPTATTTELRRLLGTPGLAAQASPSPGAPGCDDGFEYTFVTPSATTVVQDCEGGHGATLDRLLTLGAGLFAH
ncbi:Kinesin-like protein KIF13B [Actinoplanes sp. SE50]|uniref:hypothetical protein n=1 Tax=unclassified Actinoplanes TaxID=2626549 RepID=UPI00023EC4F6|nr:MULTISPECIES: hypothetical protein [unclassified Actinoplanes]AEV87019.1 Kinesin-like protein KIF13B [Actinoplanes sp. SE50/110]ATO85417.1 Kinesin-like protein KIF13B [Actinoplanes sp. SE50]SLM02829.1 Kinesin-like protein KIF13B [Actinoplanes sp. SE50/110]